MALTGPAKTAYMREYMRKRRGTKRQDAPGATISVRPILLDPPKKVLDPIRLIVRPEQAKTMGASTMDTVATLHSLCNAKAKRVQVQHTNPMMVGYEPPR